MRIVDSKNYKKSNTDRDQSMNKRGLKIIASCNPANPQSHPNHNRECLKGGTVKFKNLLRRFFDLIYNS
jgi:hypothetical protein